MVAAAVVCHGGYGSTLGALRHGVPLVVMPLFSSDQWVNAAAVARAGAGRIADASDTLPPVDAAVDVLAAISAGHAAEPPVPAA
jgi:UDP:flavonoid glycosyltransferase YjiC (YdhE family)